MKNQIDNVVNEFGEEWARFRQNKLTKFDHSSQFDSYFNIFPWNKINKSSVGADIGCGSGRWASMVVKK